MIIDFQKAINIVESYKKKGKKVGYITGCFDILHINHIELFIEAKEKIDILVIGIENDESIEISKGEGKPINNLSIRLKQISELRHVDYVFAINEVYKFGSDEAISVHKKLLKKLKPNCLLTRITADKYWKRKLAITKELNIGFIPINKAKTTSSSEIFTKLIETE